MIKGREKDGEGERKGERWKRRKIIKGREKRRNKKEQKGRQVKEKEDIKKK